MVSVKSLNTKQLKNYTSNNPVIYPVSSPTDIDQDTIILRDRGDDEEKNRRKIIDFTDNEQTILWRTNLRIINKCLSSHWVDIDMSDAQWDKMQKVIIRKRKIDLFI